MGFLQIFIIALLASCAHGSNQEDYVVLVPKIIRPGLTANIQYNTRGSSQYSSVVTEISQNNQKKFSSNHSFTPGKVFDAPLSVPSDLRPGAAQIRVAFQLVNPSAPEIVSYGQVTVVSKSVSIFIQTDKAQYKPSQTVNFRVVVIDSKMMPYRGSCDIAIKDPEGNKIKQWNSVKLESGTLTLNLELSDQPVLGDWTIRAVTNKGEAVEKKVTVAKYVLPKFEVNIDAPSFMLVKDSQLKVTVEAKYTFGKGVDGTAIVTMKNNHGGQSIELKDLSLVDGKVEALFTKQLLDQMSLFRTGDKLKITANVTEKLTGIQRKDTSELTIYNYAEKLEFLASSPSTFKPGLTYRAYLSLTQVDGGIVLQPKQANVNLAFKSVAKDSSIGGFWHYPRYITNSKDVTVNFSSNGLAELLVDVPAGTDSTTIYAKYDNKVGVTASKTIKQTKSQNSNFLQLSLDTLKPKANSAATFTLSTTKSNQIIDYQIWARGSMITSGSIIVDTKSSFSVGMQAEMAPSARILAYAVVDGELLVDSLNFNVEGAFDRNKVAVSYSKESAQPGESVDVQVTAVSGSMVGLLAVDQSVLLLAGGNDITQADVVSQLQSYDTVSKPVGFFWYPYVTSGEDTKKLLDNSGLLALTSAKVYEAEPTGGFGDIWRIRPLVHLNGFANEAFAKGALAPRLIEKQRPPPTGTAPSKTTNSESVSVRKVFPESWLWSNVTSVPPIAPMDAMRPNNPPPTDAAPPTGAAPPRAGNPEIVRKVFPESWLWSNVTSVNGQVVVTTTVPDTITSWVASAFAVSDIAGLGVSPETAKMRVFRPFFVSLNLPYSVVRGEQLVLQAIVFNYLDRDANVTVTLPESDEYRSIVIDVSGSTRNVKRQEAVTVLAVANRGTTISFPIVPVTIGSMKVKVTATTPGAADAVQRVLLVEAEGVQKEYNQAVLINLSNSSLFTETLAIDLPSNVVSDSVRVEFSLIGDVMGTALTGLDKLIRMPYGCGEQNMLNFAPTIFVTEYLMQTNQLTAETKTKSLGFMEKGYQRELTYQREDGSFSAFGQSDRSGSMWLTAFVVKSFQQAKSFIFVDEEIISKAVGWIIRRQNSDGSFPEPGRILHKGMTGGGASSDVTLTAFVLIAISDIPQTSSAASANLARAQKKAQIYLDSHVSALSDPYSLALTSYALFKAGSSNVDRAFLPLEMLAKHEGGMQYWHQPQPTPATNSKAWRAPHQQGRAIDIELAGYVLQLVTERSGVTEAMPILKWISSQRNSNGGFSSTQDTVVALQALAKYAKVAFGSSNMTVDVAAAGQTNSYSFSSSNALLLQSRVLDADTKSVSISASGSGVALAQVSVSYNVEAYEQEPAFDTVATIIRESDNRITVRVCTRWLLGGTTGMAVKEIGIPSGFTADIEALEMERYDGVKRIEEGDRKVILYFDELTSEEKCVEVNADRTGLVAKARPVAVKVYDYYEPENQQTIFYSSSRLGNINICDVCGDNCEGCFSYWKRK
ncbi:CD109 antigen-like [Watersipora subatra]|uniref:CD109 antigen-like n=1 Tax=Watersipora subatra TaxID=2589382 RepID=UPI00355AEF6C